MATSNSDVSPSNTLSKNVLLNYSSFTPVISLYIGTPVASYNTLMSNHAWNGSDWYLIAKTGGVGASRSTGSYFTTDLYMDDLTMDSIVGLNQENRGSNVTEMEFTITQPNGMDLIEQLHDFCTNILGEPNYCQVPFALKVHFEGYTDSGSLGTIPSSVKYIPIHLINMSTKLSSSGAVYKINAIPYNEVILTEQYARIPSSIELAGTDSFVKYPSATNGKSEDQNAAQYHADLQSASQSGAGFINIGAHTTINSILSKFMECLNNFQNQLQQDINGYVPDQYVIEFENDHDDYYDHSFSIKQATISGDAIDKVLRPASSNNIAMGDPVSSSDSYDLAKAASWKMQFIDKSSSSATTGVEYSQGKISFNQGSNIIDAMNTVIINSTYITEQIRRYNQAVQEIILTGDTTSSDAAFALADLNDTPLNWFIVTPKIEMLGTYDYTRNVYPKKITYVINPYTIYNSSSISVSNGNPETRIVKEYDYIFTGKNVDILDFNIEFQNAFLTYSQYTGQNKSMATGGKMPNDSKSSPATLKPKPDPINRGSATVMIANNTKNTSGVGEVTPEMAQSADVAATIYSLTDLLSLNLTVFGDPDYIKQDGILKENFYSGDTAVNSSGSPYLSYNTGEVYVRVNFKIPNDVNLQTGIMNVAYNANTTEHRRSVFSGNYRILTVKSKISKGMFTQELEMYKYNNSHEF